MKYFIHFQTAFDERTEDDLAKVSRVYMLPHERNNNNKDVQSMKSWTGINTDIDSNQSIVGKWKEIERRWIESRIEELNHGKI